MFLSDINFIQGGVPDCMAQGVYYFYDPLIDILMKIVYSKQRIPLVSSHAILYLKLDFDYLGVLPKVQWVGSISLCQRHF